MPGSGQRRERLAALFFLGVVLFNPPLLELFDGGADSTVFGVPLLYAYLFFAWAVVIALIAAAIDRRPAAGGAPEND